MSLLILLQPVKASPENDGIAASYIDGNEYIPDPLITEAPVILIHGEASEFEGSFHDDDYGLNYVNLTWQHVANTSLEKTTGSSSEQMPYFWDFVYFFQAFDWDRNQLPYDANFSFTYKSIHVGDFDSEIGRHLFRVYAWVIDSSGNWEMIFESSPPHPLDYTTQYRDMNYFDLINGWEGMIEDENGMQEDPADSLRVAIGLAPSQQFEIYDDMYPWKEYNGSVTILVSGISMIVYVEVPDIMSFDPLVLGVIVVGIVVLVALVRRER
ncbi:MAG: hypothetical protein ACXAEN_23525 [Candidatus Thorarchaeota archaeon]